MSTFISGVGWFKLSVTWPDDEQYQAFQLMVSNMQVVTDITAEREVKVCNDFIGTFRDEA